jgi:hypothetical protein
MKMNSESLQVLLHQVAAMPEASCGFAFRENLCEDLAKGHKLAHITNGRYFILHSVSVFCILELDSNPSLLFKNNINTVYLAEGGNE